MTNKRYTVQQLATLSGVSVRTLHYYDRIGLLVPAFHGDNGYRYYRRPELLRLHQILLYREFGLPLEEIGPMLEQDPAERIGQLRAQQQRLREEAERFRLLVDTIDRTIASLTTQGETKMNDTDLYKGFSPEQAQAYQTEAERRYGAEDVTRSTAVVAGMRPAERQAALDDLAEIELAFAHLLRQAVPPGDARLAPLVARHRKWIGMMWGRECAADAHAGLAQVYKDTPDFRLRYEAIAAGLTDYLAAAIVAHKA
jgi:DNA-binding transcriptional MerR regulator